MKTIKTRTKRTKRKRQGKKATKEQRVEEQHKHEIKNTCHKMRESKKEREERGSPQK
jgi:hypothetical protein